MSKTKAYTLIGADGKSYESPARGTLGGHRKDKIYGTLDCKGAARWITKGFTSNRASFPPTKRPQSPLVSVLATNVSREI